MQDPMDADTPGAAKAGPAQARPSLSGGGASFSSTRAPRPRSTSANAAQALRAGRAREAFKRAITASNAAKSSSASGVSPGLFFWIFYPFIKEYW